MEGNGPLHHLYRSKLRRASRSNPQYSSPWKTACRGPGLPARVQCSALSGSLGARLTPAPVLSRAARCLPPGPPRFPRAHPTAPWPAVSHRLLDFHLDPRRGRFQQLLHDGERRSRCGRRVRGRRRQGPGLDDVEVRSLAHRGLTQRTARRGASLRSGHDTGGIPGTWAKKRRAAYP